MGGWVGVEVGWGGGGGRWVQVPIRAIRAIGPMDSNYSTKSPNDEGDVFEQFYT